MKKILSLILVLSIIFSSLPVESIAADDTPVSEITKETVEEATENTETITNSDSNESTAENVESTTSSNNETTTKEESSASYCKKDGVEAANVYGPAASDIEETKEILSFKNINKKVAGKLFAPPLKSSGPFVLDDIPRQGDGSNIESIAAKWITPDTVENGDDALLYQKPSDDEMQSVRLQINYALSGEHNYEPGDITITVPTTMFKRRNGKKVEEIIIPYAEDPSTKTDFNWKQVGDTYILTNTKQMSAATKGYIQFEFTNLIPHELVDMEVSDSFDAIIQVTTHKGNTIGLKSNALNAQFDTEAKVTSVVKKAKGAPYVVSADEIPEEQRIPGENEYVVVDWYVRGNTKANTEYKLYAIDTIPNEYQSILINETETRKSEKLIYEGHEEGQTSYYSYRTAYPASQFHVNTEYIFHNNIEFKVVELDPAAEVVNPNVSDEDPQLITTVNHEAEVPYMFKDPVWIHPPGHFYIIKNGNDDTEEENTTHHKKLGNGSDIHIWENKKDDPYGWYGIYHSALNEIQDEYKEHGKDGGIRLSYTIDSIGYAMPWMFDANSYETDHEMAPRKSINYTRPVKMTTQDKGISITRNGEKLKVGTDFKYLAVEFPDEPWLFQGTPKNINPDGSWAAMNKGDGTFEYKRDNDKSHWPDIQLEIQRNNEWIPWATASWKTGQRVLTLHDGSHSNAVSVDVPADTQNIRTVVVLQNTSEDANANIALQAAIDYDIRPVVFLYSTQKLNTMVNGLFDRTKEPSMEVWNEANLIAERNDTIRPGEERELVNLNNDGYDVLNGYTTDISVYPYKSSKQTVEDIDSAKQQVTIHYSAKVEERTIIHSKKTYEQAIADGRLLEETHGIWRDLLPPGVSPVLDSIQLRKNDTITNVYTIEDYHNSGRTLLVVEADLTNKPEQYKKDSITYYEDVPSISFDATYGFDAVQDYGDELHNVISFESNNDKIGTVDGYSGEPDDPYQTNNVATDRSFENEEEKDAMKNLHPGKETPSFVYAGTTTRLSIPSAAKTSLSKDVMVNNDGWWSTGVYYDDPEGNKRTVYEGGQYAYRLRMLSDADTISKDLILFDSLENFYAGTGNDVIDIDAPRWQGYFRSVDVSNLQKMGCAPVVYYSTVENLQLSDETNPDQGHPINTKLNSPVWVKADDYQGNLDNVKAIAVDASKKPDGSDFVLQPEQSVLVFVKMQAPAGADARHYISQKGIWGDSAHAYNNIYMLCTSIDIHTMESDSDNFVRKDYTKIGLVEHKVLVKKEWDDDDNRDGKRPESIQMRLYADGEATEQTLTLPIEKLNPSTGSVEKVWEASFDHLPYTDPEGNKIIYSIKEDAVPHYKGNVKRTDTGFKIINKHEPEKINISGQKTWENDNENLRPQSIMVGLYKNGEFYKKAKVTPDAAGKWNYSFKNLYKYENGEEIQYTIQEIDSENKSKSYNKEINGFDIKNIYHPYGDIELTKTVLNATDVSKNQTFDFTFQFTKGEGEEEEPVTKSYDYDILEGNDVKSSGHISSNGKISIKGGQKIHIKELDEYIHYKVKESSEEGFSLDSSTNTSGTIQPNQNNEIQFTNKYKAKGSFNIRATKKLKNKDLLRAMFIYELYSEDDELIKLTSNDKKSSTQKRPDETVESSIAPIVFGSMRYTEADHGKTYTYKIKERNAGKDYITYDDTEYTVDVSITDLGDGTLQIIPVYKKNSQEIDEEDVLFTNEYSADGELQLTAGKELKGRDLQNEEFSFTLYDEDGHVVSTAKNDSHGDVKFPKISYDEKDIGKTFHYYVKENAGEDATVKYDESVFGYYVTVVDNNDGTLSFVQGYATPVFDGNNITAWSTDGAQPPEFHNTLNPGSLSIKKKVKDADSADPNQEFKFKVKLIGDDITDKPIYYNVNGLVPVIKYSHTPNVSDDGTQNGNYPANLRLNDIVKIDGASKLKITITYGGENRYDYLCAWPGEHPSYTASANGSTSAIGKLSGGSHTNSANTKEYIIDGDTITFAYHSDSAGFGDGYGYYAVVQGLDAEDEYVTTAQISKPIHTAQRKKKKEEDTSLLSEFLDFINPTVTVHAATVQSGTSRTCSWEIDDEGTLTIKPTDGVSGTLASYTSSYLPPWKSYSDSINKIVIKPGVKTDANASCLFYGCNKCETMDLSELDTSDATNMSEMFDGCSKLSSLDLSNFDTNSTTNMYGMFDGCYSLPSLDLSNFDTSNVTNMGHMFSGCRGLTSLNISSFDTSNVTNMSYMFDGCNILEALDVSHFDTSNVKYMDRMFYGLRTLTTLDVSGFDTSNVRNMESMFSNCYLVSALDVSGFDTSKVTDMEAMFFNCNKITELNVSGFNTEKVSSMVKMFYGCSKLTSLDVSNFNTSKITDTSFMFGNCSSLTSLNISGIDTSKVTIMKYMFYGCSSLPSLDVSDLNTSKVTTMEDMFAKCSSLTSLDLSGFDTSHVTVMDEMFNSCSNLESLDISSFNTSSVTTMKTMFDGSDKLASVDIGNEFSFKGNSISDTTKQSMLPTPNTDVSTGKWIKEDGTVDAKTPEELRDQYDANVASWAGTWVWEPLPPNYNLTFTGENISGGSMPPQSVPAAESYVLPANTLYKRGYVFDHWSDGLGNTYPDKGIIPANTYHAQDNITLNAVFIPKSNTTNMVGNEFEVSILADEVAVINDIPAGTKYQIYEETPNGWVLVNQSNDSGEIEALQTSKASFTNKYQPGVTTAQFTGTKTLDDKPVNAGSYRFELYEGSAKLQEKEVKDTGLISFDPIQYTEAGDHTYTIKEVNPENPKIVYDNHTETIRVHVADDGHSNLTATVSYDADGVLFKNRTVKKSLTIEKNGSPITDANKDDQFHFKVVINGKTQTVSCKAGETITISDIPIDSEYRVEEINLPPGWQIHGDSIQTGTIDNGENTIVFTNDYVASGSVDLMAYKKMDKGSPNDGDYQFRLTGNAIDEIATNGTAQPDGIAPVYFSTIHYTQEDIGHTYQYVIKEIPDATNQAIHFDSSEIHVSVSIEDAGQGRLHVEETYENNNQTFTNTHKKASLIFTKNILSAPDERMNDSFEFTINLPEGTYPTQKYINGNPTDSSMIESGQKVSLHHGESFEITELPDGENYSIVETPDANWILDSALNDTGTLEAGKTTYASFNNRYTEEYHATGTAQIVANKTINSGTLEDGFLFELLDENEEVIERKEVDNPNGNTSTITFTPLEFTEEDADKTYHYTIREIAGDNDAIAYDETEYPVTIEVHDPGTGTLKCNVSYTVNEGGTERITSESPTFRNERTGSLKLSKIVQSDEEIDPNTQFHFTITLEDRIHTGPDIIVFNKEGFENNVAHVSVFANDSITINHLPLGMNYTITEDEQTGYEQIAKVADTGTISDTMTYSTFTNKYTASNATAEVQKIWNDNNDMYQTRPDHINVKLLANGNPVNEFTIESNGNEIPITDGIVRLDFSNNWHAKAIKLPDKDGSQTIVYTWQEIIEENDNIDKYYREPSYYNTTTP